MSLLSILPTPQSLAHHPGGWLLEMFGGEFLLIGSNQERENGFRARLFTRLFNKRDRNYRYDCKIKPEISEISSKVVETHLDKPSGRYRQKPRLNKKT